MLAADVDNREVREAMIADADALVARLTLGLTLTSDAGLQAALRGSVAADDDAPLFVRLPEAQAWVRLAPGQPAQVLREPEPGAPQLHLGDRAGLPGPLRHALLTAERASIANQQALDLLSPIFDTETAPTRDDIRALLTWAPLLERTAYRYCARTITLLDGLRPALTEAIGRRLGSASARTREYWSCLHTASHLYLLAASPDARPWLSEMAASFDWVSWTPSLPLVRERTLWLAAVAARSAAAFGAPVVPRYLEALARADHPLKLFDALLGLTAIALDEPGVADDILSGLRVARPLLARRSYAAFTDWMVRASTRTIRSGLSDGGDPSRGQRPDIAFLGPISLRQDPTTPLASARPLAFAALPALMRTPIEAWYGSGRRVDVRVAADDQTDIFQRAWNTGAHPAVGEAIH